MSNNDAVVMVLEELLARKKRRVAIWRGQPVPIGSVIAYVALRRSFSFKADMRRSGQLAFRQAASDLCCVTESPARR